MHSYWVVLHKQEPVETNSVIMNFIMIILNYNNNNNNDKE